MGAAGRNAVLNNCCQLVELLSTGRHSVEDLSNEIQLTHKTIRRYLETISIYFPLCEDTEQAKTHPKNVYWINKS